MNFIDELVDVFRPRREIRRPHMGESDLERWSHDLEKREANNGMGMCNTGSGVRITCIFGGIGCNVDHAWIGMERGRK